MEDSIQGITVSGQIHTQLFIHSFRQLCLSRMYLADHELESVRIIYHYHYYHYYV